MEARLRKEDVQGYLKKQVDARQKKAEEEFKAELAEAARTQALLD
jgi:hypothetical protein